MATDDPTNKRVPKAPIGDLPMANDRVQSTRDLSASQPAAGTATAAPAPAAAQLAAPAPAPVPGLPAPPNFIGDAAGNVQRNTASAQWTTTPGAAPAPAPSAAAQLAAPNLQTTPGAAAPPGVVDVPSPTRAVQVPAAAAPLQATVAGTPTPVPAFQTPATGGPAVAGDGTISPDSFAQRTAAARSADNTLRNAAQRIPPVTGTAGVAPNVPGAAEALATPVEAPAPGIVSRTAGAVGRGLGKIGKAAGYAGAALEGTEAVGNGIAGNYGDAAQGLGLAGLDLAATRAPTPITVGGALVGHAASALAGTDLAQRGFRATANALPGSGDRNVQAQEADLDATMQARQARGLPIPADYQNARQRLTDIRAGIEGTASPGKGPVADLIAPGTSARSQADNAALIAPPVNPPAAAPANGTAPAATATAAPGATPAGTPVTSATAQPGAPVGPQQQTALDQLKSPTVGTATINGKTLTPDQILDAGKRLNTVDAGAFTNVAPGVLYSEATGGKTLSSNEAVNQRMNAGGGGGGGGGDGLSAGQRLANYEQSIERGHINDRINANNKIVDNLQSQAIDAIQHGRRHTAEALGQLIGQVNNGTSTAQTALTARGGALPPKTPAEQQLEALKVQEAQGSIAGQNQTMVERREELALRRQLATETDPAKAKLLRNQLSAYDKNVKPPGEDKAPPKPSFQSMMIGTGVNATKISLQLDPNNPGHFLGEDDPTSANAIAVKNAKAAAGITN